MGKNKKFKLIFISMLCITVTFLGVFIFRNSKADEYSELLKIVDYDEGLKAAVKKGFAQQINKSYTDNGITLTIENIIFDSRRLIIIYAIESEKEYAYIMPTWRISGEGNDKYFIGSMSPLSDEEGKFHRWEYEIKYDFKEESIPDKLLVKCTSMEGRDKDRHERKTIKGNWHIEFNIDKDKLKEAEPIEYNLNKKIELKDISFSLDYLRIHPTVMDLKITMDHDNEYTFEGLNNIYIEDEKGNIYRSTGGTNCSKKGQVITFKSPYFNNVKSLKVKCDNIYIKPKKDEYILVDLDNKKVIDDSGYNVKFLYDREDTESFINREEKVDYLFCLSIEDEEILKAAEKIHPAFGIQEIKDEENEQYTISHISPILTSKPSNDNKYSVEYIIEIKDMKEKPHILKFKVTRALKYKTESFNEKLF